MLVALVACGGGEGNSSANGGGAAPAAPVLSSVGIDASSSSVSIGGTTQLTPVGRDQRGIASSATFTWASSNEAIAMVSASGVVTGVATGAASVKVVATAGAASAAQSVVINVMPPYSGPAPPVNVLVNDPHRDSYPNLSQHEPSIGVFGPRIVVSWIDRSIQGETIRGVDFGVGYGNSSNSGETFVDRGRLGSTSWGFDPSVAVDGKGNFYIGRGDLDNGAPGGTSQPDRVAIFKSNDGGMSFPRSAGVSGNTPATPGINDKPTITTDNSGGPFDGSIYVSWTFARLNVLNILFSQSRDGGASFFPPLSLSSGPLDQGSIPAIGPGGEVYVVWLDNSYQVLVRKSTDGGETFKSAVTVAPVDAIGGRSTGAPTGCGLVLNGDVRARSWPSVVTQK